MPTLDRPHYDVVLPELADATLDRLELGFDRSRVVPGTIQDNRWLLRPLSSRR